ncbi:putative glycosidase CRH2 [Polyrhizophydium stewartii]|uniref:Glycosidase CRH2 n=1 Tax=Polyrhizophydium stewartii TaxID=2732419 RepID=A0ABR4NBG5_9FUNG
MTAFLLPLLAAAALAPAAVQAQANVTGSCVTGRITFDRLRTYSNVLPGSTPKLNVSTYDMIIDYASKNVEFPSTGGASLALIKDPSGKAATGTRVSTTRYILYGKVTARFSALSLPGAVTTFISMSDRKDEIDWEIVGKDLNSAQTNVFYKGIPEFALHGSTEAVADVSKPHEYTIDWKHNTLSWAIDGVVKRTLNKDTSISPLTPPGERWYPSTPSLFQISVWDGGASDSKGTSDWAGGAIQWGSRSNITALYEWIDIQCYDDHDNPVPKWPADATVNPDKKAAPSNQPTSNDPKQQGNAAVRVGAAPMALVAAAVFGGLVSVLAL